MLRVFSRYETSLFLPFLSGVLLVMTLPYVGFWPLIWVALVPFLLFATNSALTRSRLCGGAVLMGFVYSLGLGYPLSTISGWWWLSDSEPFVLTLIPQEIFYVGALMLLALWFALWFIPVAFVARHTWNSPSMPIVVSLVWTIFEWPHAGFGPNGFTWGALGYALVDMPYLKFLAGVPYLGVYALTFIVVFANATFVLFLRYLKERTGSPFERFSHTIRIFAHEWKTYFGFWLFVALFGGSFFFGISQEFRVRNTFAPVSIALVSSDIPTLESVTTKAYWEYRGKVKEVLSQGATLVLLPENVFPFFEVDEQKGKLSDDPFRVFPSRDSLYADFLALSLAHPDATIIVGLHTLDDGKKYNSAVFYKNGEIEAIYHKRILVPFTERAPKWTGLRILEDLTPGAPVQYVQVAGMSLASLICSEVSATTLDIHHASVIISPSNDSVFTNDASARMQEQMSKMRALESGAYVLRSSKGGISSVIDPSGREIATGHNGIVRATIMPPKK